MSKILVEASGAYEFEDIGSAGHHAYNLPTAKSMFPTNTGSVLDVGCGAGQATQWLHDQGFNAWGCDLSESGIELARKHFKGPQYFVSDLTNFDKVSAEQGVELPEGGFDGILSLEVIEHLYDPEDVLRNCAKALKPNGWIVLTTPYHGYVKNLTLAMFNKYDDHWMVESPGGHIKFFSKKSLTEMMTRVGFVDIKIKGAGRGPLIWCSMVVSARLG